MSRTIWALGLVVFLAACGGGGAGGPRVTPEDIQERAIELAAANPIFLGSDAIIVHEDYSFVLPEDEEEPTCVGNRCVLDDQETTLAAFLGAEGFNYINTLRGVDLGRGHLQHFEGEILRYGGWLGNSAFAVHSGVLTDGEPGQEGYVEENIIHSYSIGLPINSNPVSGSASWTGMMVGADVSEGSSTTGNFVHGNATLTVDFAAANVGVSFDEITDLTTGRSHPDMDWTDIPMEDGSFAAGTTPGEADFLGEYRPEEINHIRGQFYGNDHGEVGGIFTRNNLHGAFGAKR